MNKKLKYALITSSTRGIGKAIGLKLLQAGYFVFFNYANNDKDATLLYDELINKYANRFHIIKSDLSVKEGVDHMCGSILSETKCLDCIVLNTGITNYTEFSDLQISEWDKVINTNLTMPFFLVQRLSKMIRENSRIIFISALLGTVPHGRSIPYAVSKAGLNMLTKSLVKEFKEKQTTVNSVAVGFVETPWHNSKSEAHIQRIKDKIALNRFGLPEEVAKTCLHIIDNQYINGAIINLDGGYDMG